MGFLDGSIGKESTCHAGDTGDVGSIPGSRRSPERGKCQPTPVFLSEKSYGQRSLVGYSPKGCKESDTTEWLCMHKHKSSVQFSSVHLLSCVWLFATPRTTVHQAPYPSPTPGVYSNTCPLNQWCHPTILSSVVPFSHLQSFPASGSFRMSQLLTSGGQSIGDFISFSIRPSNEYSGLIFFRMDWLDLLSVQRTLKSLLQHHSSKLPILQCSAFFIVQLSHPYMTTGKTIALTRQTFFGRVMSLLFNILSRFV